MHCASCTGSVESGLAEVPGVLDVAVNLASGQALVLHALGQADPDALRAAVKRSGFTVLDAAESDQAASAAADSLEDRRLRERRMLGLQAAFALAVGVLAFWGSAEFIPWAPDVLRNPWTLLVLVTPVQFWAGWRFYRGTWLAARRATTDMNTLIAVGTSAAYGYSVVLTVWPGLLSGVAGRGRSLLRSLGGHHRAGPARPVRRGWRQGACIRRDPASPRSQVQDGPRRARRPDA